jgi:hypothetical protein
MHRAHVTSFNTASWCCAVPRQQHVTGASPRHSWNWQNKHAPQHCCLHPAGTPWNDQSATMLHDTAHCQLQLPSRQQNFSPNLPDTCSARPCHPPEPLLVLTLHPHSRCTHAREVVHWRAGGVVLHLVAGLVVGPWQRFAVCTIVILLEPCGVQPDHLQQHRT